MTSPRVSIGLPVFNGERYLPDTIAAILAQSFSDLELLISDNASTDRTEEICREFAAHDPRVRYHRNADNIGAAPNFNDAFLRSRGEYFKWAADDDGLAPDFVKECVDVLDADRSIVLVYSGVRIIDASGNAVRDHVPELHDVGSSRPHRRFADLILVDHQCYEIFGMVRASVLRQTPLLGSYIASDRVLLGELGLRGRFHEIPKRLFFSRDHPARSVRSMPIHFRATWFDPANRGRRVYPHARCFLEHYRSIGRAGLARSERFRCYLDLLRWPIVNMNWARVAADVVAAVSPRSVPTMLTIKDRISGSQHRAAGVKEGRK